MGRHADPNPRHFYRSMFAALLRGLAILAVAAGAFWLVVQYGLQGGDPPQAGTPAPTPAERASPPAEPPASPTARPTRASTPVVGTQATVTTDAVIADARDPAQTTVQVLNGSGDDATLGAVVEVLEELGYQVVAVNPARRAYEVTTVFYTAGNEAEAEALRALDPRFAEVAANEELAQEVDLHVVVGADWSQ